MEQLILGMLAHVDAGKTTLTESLLYEAGVVAEMGRVDHGTAFLDTDSMEKSRGITIYSKEARFSWGDWEITLVDTPGHVDFSHEMERSLSVLDYGVLVISGSDGVQAHTETLWKLLERHALPVFVFVNKMDLPDVDASTVLADLQERLDSRFVNFSKKDFFEDVALCDESMLSRFEGSFTAEEIAEAIASRKVFPCIFGSALKQEGISEFLDCISSYVKQKDTKLANQQKLSGKVYKITRDSAGNRLTHLKVLSGNLSVKDLISWGEGKEKVNEIRLYSGKKYQSVFSVGTGTVCAVTGLLHSEAGGNFGELVAESTGKREISQGYWSYILNFTDGTDGKQVLSTLKQLEEEDPCLQMAWLEERQCIQISLMGSVQEEVLLSVIWERFGLRGELCEGHILYRESIRLGSGAELVEGVGHFEPLRHYAEVLLHLRPLPVDSGLEIDCDCSAEDLPLSYQHLVLEELRAMPLRGRMIGAVLTDMRITLVGGRSHLKHSAGGDFREATLRALHHGLRQCSSVLLEPWYRLELIVPTEHTGRVLSDVHRMGGMCEIESSTAEESVLFGEVALSQLGNYSVSGFTGGRGRMSKAFLGYRPCVDAASVVARSGYEPEVEGASIFCKDGGGYTVPWGEVASHMHCPSRLPKEEFVALAPKVLQQRRQHFADSLSEDKALMEIFQRTYGKINPQHFRSKAVVVERTYVAQKLKPRYLLVDGYNIIFAWGELTAMAQENLSSARERLLHLMSNYQAFYGGDLAVVFDAYQVKGGVGSIEPWHNITVVYTREAETADNYIERCTHSLATAYQVRVATSDSLEQLIIMGQGAFRVSARVFLQEIQQMEREMEKFLF